MIISSSRRLMCYLSTPAIAEWFITCRALKALEPNDKLLEFLDKLNRAGFCWLALVEKKFGPEVLQRIEQMTQIQLKRKLYPPEGRLCASPGGEAPRT